MRFNFVVYAQRCKLCAATCNFRVEYMQRMRLFRVLLTAVPGGNPHETYPPGWKQDGTMNIS